MASWPKKSFRGTLNIRPKGWKSYVEEVLARATSIKDAIDHLRQGTVLWKIRDKGIRGLVIYKRKYRLDMAELRIHYTPNKMITGKNCTAGGPGSMPAIDLGDIAEIRAGHSTDTFNTLGKQNKTLSDGRLVIDNVNCHRDFCFSIVFNDDTAPLDLVADNETTRDLWINALTHLVVTIKSLGQQKEYELFLRKQFKKADKNGNGALNLKECHDLIEQLNIKMSLDELRGLFKAANFIKAKGNEEEALDEAEFVTFYYSLLKRPELDEVFIRYATKEGPRMSPEDLLKFLTVEQQMEMTTEEVEKMIDAFEPTADKSTLSNEGFTHFMMFSDWQEITDPAKRLVYQDMNQPLSHYWIAASHNTYLMGNQVTGESSVDAYIKALKEGCRCVELDCWDGSDGEPIIYHGWTLTSKISFEEVMRDAIKPYAFHSSDYPLILSIENHCSIEQQDKMADHMKAILGDSLFTDPTDDEKNELPSPEALKHKILVKGKKLPPGQSQGDDIDEDDNDDDDVEDLDEKRKEKAKKLSQKLSDCVNYVEAVHFHGFDDQAKYYHMSSFGETKAFKFLESARIANTDESQLQDTEGYR